MNRLVNDEDASLSANSLLTYMMLIKQKKPSVEGKLIEGYINRRLWDNMHQQTDGIFEIPISLAT